MTTLRDTALADVEPELASLRRFLERVPDGQMAWKPHPKSMTLGRLSMHLAEIPGGALRILDDDAFHFSAPGATPPVRREATTRAEALETLAANTAKLRDALGRADDATLMRPWTFSAFGKVIFTQPKIIAFRTRVLSHLIHHRAQLGVYLRLLDVPLPPTAYGPSADERP